MKKFTLIELLVVIAIIGVLASMLLPTLSKARQKSQSALCKSNLKQISMAVLTYSTDNDNWAPLDQSSNSSTSWNWNENLSSLGYLNFDHNKDVTVYHCPNGLDISQNWHSNYGMNFRLVRGDASGGFDTNPLSYSYLSKIESNHASDTLMVSDGHDNLKILQSSAIGAGTLYDDNPVGSQVIRHGNKANLSFLDGHVDSFSGEQYLSTLNYQSDFWTP